MRGKQAKDLTGMRFGRWTVLERAGSYKPKIREDWNAETSMPQWKCRCDCGTVAIVIGENLKSGNSKSCGCYRTDLMREKNKAKKEAAKHDG